MNSQKRYQLDPGTPQIEFIALPGTLSSAAYLYETSLHVCRLVQIQVQIVIIVSFA